MSEKTIYHVRFEISHIADQNKKIEVTLARVKRGFFRRRRKNSFASNKRTKSANSPIVVDLFARFLFISFLISRFYKEAIDKCDHRKGAYHRRGLMLPGLIR